MQHVQAFSPDYATAQDRFRQASRSLGAICEAVPITARGPDGQSLDIDVTRIGPALPARAVVISSGLHGVEGFFGSAIQLAWLHSFACSGQTLPEGLAIVLLHALNPFGFAWRRRVNERNVDLNRNFLLPGELFTGASPEVRQLNGFINPTTPPPRISLFLPTVWWLIVRHGSRALQAAVTTGQYDFPEGLFYGGAEHEETTRLLSRHFADWTGRASDVLHLDLHSGLGRFGQCKLLSVETCDSPRGRWLAARFGNQVEPPGGGVRRRGPSRGGIGTYLGTLHPGLRQYAYLAPEFGTYPGIRVFQALREENRARHFPDHPALERSRRRLAEVFCPANPLWREQVVAEGIRLIERAIDVCRDEPWELSASEASGRSG